MSNTLVLFDIDDTIVNGQSQKFLILYLRKKRIISFAYFISIYAWFILYKLSVIHNPLRVLEYALKFLEGKSEEQVAQIMHDFVETVLTKKMYSEAITCIRGHQEKNHTVVLVSNAIEPLVNQVALYLAVHHHLATTLEVKGGKFTGLLERGPVYGGEKVERAKSFMSNSNLLFDEIYAYADHHSDVPLLEFSTHPYATNPTPKLYKIAKQNSWSIVEFT